MATKNAVGVWKRRDLQKFADTEVGGFLPQRQDQQGKCCPHMLQDGYVETNGICLEEVGYKFYTAFTQC